MTTAIWQNLECPLHILGSSLHSSLACIAQACAALVDLFSGRPTEFAAARERLPPHSIREVSWLHMM
jgi:hypothetical protein